MNILEIISGEFINGACVYCSLLVSELVDRGHQVTLVARPNSWIWRQVEHLPIERVESNLNRLSPFEMRRLAKTIHDSQIDVMHTHMSRAHSVGILMKWMTGVPCVATAHNRYLQLHWRFNDLVIANSEATRKFHCRVNRVRPDRIKTIHCFVDQERFSNLTDRQKHMGRRQLGVRDDRPLLGVVGEVTERKGQIYLFKALPALLEAYPDLRLAVLGRYDKKRAYDKLLRRFLFRNNLFRKVIWAYERDNIEKIISGLDVCVVPSIEEPQGLVALEAMAAGVPVVATNVGGLPEIVEHESTGLLVDARSEDQLAAAVLRVLGSEELRKKLVTNADFMVRSRFSADVLTAKVESAFGEVLSKRKAA